LSRRKCHTFSTGLSSGHFGGRHFKERGPDGLLNGKSPGQPSKLNDVQRQAIVRIIESGPIPAVHGVVRWRLIDLAQWIFEEFSITIALAAIYDDASRLRARQ
jgi:transposase